MPAVSLSRCCGKQSVATTGRGPLAPISPNREHLMAEDGQGHLSHNNASLPSYLLNNFLSLFISNPQYFVRLYQKSTRRSQRQDASAAYLTTHPSASVPTCIPRTSRWCPIIATLTSKIVRSYLAAFTLSPAHCHLTVLLPFSRVFFWPFAILTLCHRFCCCRPASVCIK